MTMVLVRVTKTIQFISIITDKYRSAQTYRYLSYHRVFVFELKQQSPNYRHVGNPPTCRQMSCRFGHPADTAFSCVCDMTETCRRHVADTTQNVAVGATKRHADIRHMELYIMVPSDMLEQCLAQPYDHYEHINNIKHLLHVWTGCDMSMKWVGVPLIAYYLCPLIVLLESLQFVPQLYLS